MSARARKPAPTEREGVDAEAALATYGGWLKRQPLAARSRYAYLAQVRGFLTWLAGSERPTGPGRPTRAGLGGADYKRHVKTAKRWAPASVNQALAAIDNFYRSLAAGRPDVLREELAQVAPRSLEEADQRRFLRIVEASPSARDRAMATVFFYAGLRLSEVAALDMADVEMSARRGRLKVRTGKGDAYREVPLNSASRKALDEWLEARTDQMALSG